MPSCWLFFYLLICIPNRQCSQIRERKNSSLPCTLLSPHNRLPCLPTSPSPILTHTEIPARSTPHPTYPLPLIAKLAWTQWAGQERMSKWKRWRGRKERRDGDMEGEEEEEDSVLPNVPVMRIQSKESWGGGGCVCQSEIEVWKEWVFISETPFAPASFPTLSLCSSCLQDLWDRKPTLTHSSNSTSAHSQTHTRRSTDRHSEHISNQKLLICVCF